MDRTSSSLATKGLWSFQAPSNSNLERKSTYLRLSPYHSGDLRCPGIGRRVYVCVWAPVSVVETRRVVVTGWGSRVKGGEPTNGGTVDVVTHGRAIWRPVPRRRTRASFPPPATWSFLFQTLHTRLPDHPYTGSRNGTSKWRFLTSVIYLFSVGFNPCPQCSFLGSVPSVKDHPLEPVQWRDVPNKRSRHFTSFF